jgi:hypothetical protein
MTRRRVRHAAHGALVEAATQQQQTTTTTGGEASAATTKPRRGACEREGMRKQRHGCCEPMRSLRTTV